MLDRKTFVTLSVALTGFDIFDLEATGEVDAYLARVVASVPGPVQQDVADIWTAIAGLGDAERRDAIRTRLFGSASVGIDVRRILMLWYTGSWYTTPPYDAEVVNGQAYVQGLMWKAIGSHPMAALPQGYGAWSLPPPGVGA